MQRYSQGLPTMLIVHIDQRTNGVTPVRNQLENSPSMLRMVGDHFLAKYALDAWSVGLVRE